jgi:hypothetical protein
MFPGINQDLKRMRVAEVVAVQPESLVALDSISVKDFRQYFQQWECHWDRCIQSQGEHFEGEQVSKLYQYFKYIFLLFREFLGPPHTFRMHLRLYKF